MLNENAKKWIAALRSGEYRQCQGVLHHLSDSDNEKDSYCCLGVACDLYLKDNPDGLQQRQKNIFTTSVAYDDHTENLPHKVQDWLGLVTALGTFSNGQCLAELNDEGHTFAEIADIIESEPKGLFADSLTND